MADLVAQTAYFWRQLAIWNVDVHAENLKAYREHHDMIRQRYLASLGQYQEAVEGIGKTGQGLKIHESKEFLPDQAPLDVQVGTTGGAGGALLYVRDSEGTFFRLNPKKVDKEAFTFTYVLPATELARLKTGPVHLKLEFK